MIHESFTLACGKWLRFAWFEKASVAGSHEESLNVKWRKYDSSNCSLQIAPASVTTSSEAQEQNASGLRLTCNIILAHCSDHSRCCGMQGGL